MGRLLRKLRGTSGLSLAKDWLLLLWLTKTRRRRIRGLKHRPGLLSVRRSLSLLLAEHWLSHRGLLGLTEATELARLLRCISL